MDGREQTAPDTYHHRHSMTEVDTTAGTCSLYILEMYKAQASMYLVEPWLSCKAHHMYLT